MSETTQVDQVQRLFLRNASPLKGFIIGLLPDSNLAEDIFQEVFLIVTRKADDFQLGTDFLHWARAIARMKVLEQHRKRTNKIVSLDPQVLDALILAAPELDDTWQPRRDALRNCLDRVAPQARKILDLRYSEGLMPMDIAERLAWSVNSVHVALARLRKSLRDCTHRRLGQSGA